MMSHVFVAALSAFVTVCLLNIAHYSGPDFWIATAWMIVFVALGVAVVTFLYGLHVEGMGFWNK